MRKIQIGVIGDSECSPAVSNLAFLIGVEIGRKKLTVICGGRGGIMEAVCQGVNEAGGLVIGILPGFNEIESGANKYLNVAIPTNLGWTRNSIVAMASDGVLVIGGRAGTLSEIAFAWMYEKPIVALVHEDISDTSWGKKLAGLAIDDRRQDIIWESSDPNKAVDLLLEKIYEKQKRIKD